MTMVSFRVPDEVAAEVSARAARLGVDRSQLLRDALGAHLARLRAVEDAERWERAPLESGERALRAVADWGPAEDWSDWADAAR